MKKDGYYSSGEFARMAHVTLRTVRYYDKQDILKPSLVTESGARFYTDEDFARLQQILLLKYLGFSLDDIREMTIGDSDYHFMLNSLNIQLRLVRDRIEQMQLVEKAIQDTAQMIKEQHTIDWSQMLNLIHLTGMEKSLKNQYQNATNISSRINLHSLYSQNKQGWFPWIFEAVPDLTRSSYSGAGLRRRNVMDRQPFPSAGGYLHHTFRYFQRYAPRCQTSHRFLGYPVCIPGL